MNAAAPSVWALVPARGGSKSIKLKNLVPLAGVPMLDFGVRAAQACSAIERVVVSSDHDAIAARARRLGAEVADRPAELATDDAGVVDVALEFLRRHPREDWPAILVLVQPTSPFLTPDHCTALIEAMMARPEARSGQTVTPIVHNHHAFNQRDVEDGLVQFRFPAERATGYNKQRKPALHVFGNLVAVRPEALEADAGFFAEPSVAVEVPRPYDIDVDTPDDLVLAEALLAAGAVDLPHMAAAREAASGA